MLVFEKKLVRYCLAMYAENYFHLLGLAKFRLVPIELSIKVEGGKLLFTSF